MNNTLFREWLLAEGRECRLSTLALALFSCSCLPTEAGSKLLLILPDAISRRNKKAPTQKSKLSIRSEARNLKVSYGLL